MKIGCLQFSAKLGQVQRNISKADELLEKQDLQTVDLLVLPELAFSGYNFSSVEEIEPFLEPTAAGVSTEWAKRTAAKLNCVVSVGYPEIEIRDSSDEHNDFGRRPRYFNSAVTVSPKGQVIANYRKSFLYYTDKPWASEGDGFGLFQLPIPIRKDANSSAATLTANGICMDINPKDFIEPWEKYEFANHVKSSRANLVILNMAWLSQPPGQDDGGEDDGYDSSVEEGGVRGEREEEWDGGEAEDLPDRHTELYWIERFRPLWQSPPHGDIILILANRCGRERDAQYAGSSKVVKIHHGEVQMWEGLGRREERCLVVDTETQCPLILSNLPIL